MRRELARAFDAQVAAYKASVDAKYTALYRELYATLDVDWTTLPNQALVASVKHDIDGHWTVRVADVDPRWVPATASTAKVLVLGVSDRLTEETHPAFARRFRELLDEQTNEHNVAERVLGRTIWR